MQHLNESQRYQFAFNCYQKFGPVKMRLIENYFPSLKEAFCSNYSELEKAGISQELVSKFIKWRKTFDLEKKLKDLNKEDINIITWHDKEYSALLLEIHSPPPLLYYIGDIGLLNNCLNRLAIVGSRQHSAYANKIVAEIMPSLTEKELIIVSGLALGVDSLAHEEALLNNGKTIAVLGSGLNRNKIYPYINRRLSQRIIESGGLIISEFPPDIGPLPQNFPQRNRIIAGLCKATLIIESKEKSGALITAYQALEQNREVLAVPGNIFSEFSKGPNEIIKKGARVILSGEDILEVYGLNSDFQAKDLKKKINGHQKDKLTFENNEEKTIYSIIKSASERAEKINTDEIAEESKLDTATINSTLSIMEIKDMIRNDFGNYYIV